MPELVDQVLEYTRQYAPYAAGGTTAAFGVAGLGGPDLLSMLPAQGLVGAGVGLAMTAFGGTVLYDQLA